MKIEIINHSEFYQQAVVGEKNFSNNEDRDCRISILPNLRLKSDNDIEIKILKQLEASETHKLKHIEFFSNTNTPIPKNRPLPFYIINEDANGHVHFRIIIPTVHINLMAYSLYPIIINKCSQTAFGINEDLFFSEGDGFLLTLRPREIITLTLVMEERPVETKIKKAPRLVRK